MTSQNPAWVAFNPEDQATWPPVSSAYEIVWFVVCDGPESFVTRWWDGEWWWDSDGNDREISSDRAKATCYGDQYERRMWARCPQPPDLPVRRSR